MRGTVDRVDQQRAEIATHKSKRVRLPMARTLGQQDSNCAELVFVLQRDEVRCTFMHSCALHYTGSSLFGWQNKQNRTSQILLLTLLLYRVDSKLLANCSLIKSSQEKSARCIYNSLPLRVCDSNGARDHPRQQQAFVKLAQTARLMIDDAV